jgi:hypothetical protein
MQSVTSTHLSLTLSSYDLCDDAAYSTHCRSSASFEVNWEILTRLAFRWSKPLDLDVCLIPSSSHQFCSATDKLSPTWFWCTNQEIVMVILRPKSLNRSCRFWDSNRKTRQPWFWGQKQEARAPRLLMHDADRTWRHLTSRSSDHRISNMCLTIIGPLH